MVRQIIERAKEIEDLLAEVLEKDRVKKEEEAEEERRKKEAEEREKAEREWETVARSQQETLSSPRVPSPPAQDYDTIDRQVEDEVDKRFGPSSNVPSKKKRRNVFARMVHAVRKRFVRRQRS